MKLQLSDLLATGFGLGKAPRAPGTVGSLLGLPVAFAFVQLGPQGYMFAAFFLALGAMLVAQIYLHHHGGEDPQEIVIDEVAGLVIALTWIPTNLVAWGFAFLLFRILDAWKPGPIGIVDQRIKGGVGVVADDLVAGLLTNVVLQIMLTLDPTWWGLLN